MKLSTRSRYGTRMLLDMAQHYNQGPVQLGDIAKRQNISPKYLEQIIIPLKKAHFVESVRGPKGGHMLAKPPEQITVGEIVYLLEEGSSLVECIEHPELCERSQNCPTRMVWQEAAQAVFDRLKAITLADLIGRVCPGRSHELNEDIIDGDYVISIESLRLEEVQDNQEQYDSATLLIRPRQKPKINL